MPPSPKLCGLPGAAPLLSCRAPRVSTTSNKKKNKFLLDDAEAFELFVHAAI